MKATDQARISAFVPKRSKAARTMRPSAHPIADNSTSVGTSTVPARNRSNAKKTRATTIRTPVPTTTRAAENNSPPSTYSLWRSGDAYRLTTLRSHMSMRNTIDSSV